MKNRFFLGIFILFILLYACAPQQPEIKVPASEVEKDMTSPIKTVTIQDIVNNINEFVDVEVKVTGKLIFRGTSYFQPKFGEFVLTDNNNDIPVTVWLPLEVPPPLEQSKKESLPLAMRDYLDKTINAQGVIKKSNERFYLDVIKATIAEKEPILKIISPKDNELIKSSKVTVEVKAENFNIVPVGEPVKEGEGHFHVWLGSERKLGPQTSFTFDNIVSGKHTIVAELVKSDHSSLSPKVTKTVTVNVESDYVPKEEMQQVGVSEFTVESDDNGFYPSKVQAKVGDTVKINFKFRDDSIYFAGLDVKGPFSTIQYKLKSPQPVTREFTMKEETKITSWWPASGVKKATLTVEVAK